MGVSTDAELPFTISLIYSKADNELMSYDIDLLTEFSLWD